MHAQAQAGEGRRARQARIARGDGDRGVWCGGLLRRVRAQLLGCRLRGATVASGTDQHREQAEAEPTAASVRTTSDELAHE